MARMVPKNGRRKTTLSTDAEVFSFNSPPQAYSFSAVCVRLRLTVKRVLPNSLYISPYLRLLTGGTTGIAQHKHLPSLRDSIKSGYDSTG